MLALSVLRPWGVAIMRHGKDIENRTWGPHTLKPGDRFAIHNAIGIDKAGVGRVLEILAGNRLAFGLDKDELLGPPGMILGTVRFCGIIRGATRLWFDGPVGWILADPRPLREPIACRGQQRLWKIPDGIAEMVDASL